MSYTLQSGNPWGWHWPSPAKINLMLRILGRRADGYHHLQTLFQILDHGDSLRFYPREDGVITRRSALPGVAEEEDLAVRAACLLQEQSGFSAGVEIEILKQLPMGGGLAGGSSNAATVLLVLNHLWQLGMSKPELAELGVQLGADVPLFVYGETAWAEGIGEQLVPVSVPACWYLIINPGCHVSTADVFSSPQLTRNSPAITIADFLAGTRNNDCLAVVLKQYPKVKQAFEWLSCRAEACMTGTGACLFASFGTQQEAEAVFMQLPAEYTGFVAAGVMESPLHTQLAAS